MRPLTGAILGLLLASAAFAQEDAQKGSGVVLRLLDKVNGTTRDLEIPNGGSARQGRFSVELGECRYPEGDPSADGFAYITVRDDNEVEPLFRGWMVASSPALNALDHARYDVWVLRCKS